MASFEQGGASPPGEPTGGARRPGEPLARQYGAVGIVTYDPIPVPSAPSVLARQCGAVGIVTYDPLPDPMAPEAHTCTTVVPVPYAWLMAHDPKVVHAYEAYETSAKTSAANGRKVWECYVLGLDPEVATNDFKIVSFPMKADGTPDLAGIVVEPPQGQWNVPATWKVKGAATLEGPACPGAPPKTPSSTSSASPSR